MFIQHNDQLPAVGLLAQLVEHFTGIAEVITGGPSSRLEKKPTMNSWTRHALCDMDNSDSKASLKQKKSPETTTDTRDMSKFYWFYM